MVQVVEVHRWYWWKYTDGTEDASVDVISLLMNPWKCRDDTKGIKDARDDVMM